MKNQNKYSQLVEAQSPEPQQTATGSIGSGAGDEDDQEDNKTLEAPLVGVVVKSDSLESVGKVYETPEGEPAEVSDTELSRSILISTSADASSSSAAGTSNFDNKANNQATTGRRSSSRGSSGSQNSTYFASTTGSVKHSPTSTMNDTANNNSISRQQQHPQTLQRHMKTNLSRSISQSMLELDHSNRLDNYEISWKNLSFAYGTKWSKRLRGNGARPAQVLNNISGNFKSNQLVAIIGPSGCGKTTLLQFLAGNNPVHKDKLRIVGLEEPKVAFIGQQDCLLPGLTARETLIYASRLQNNRPGFDHQQHIMPIVEGLGLAECANRSVTKLSGGQAKRVTIAQELLYPTNLLILDEVTSGLDASTSYSIVKLLKRLVTDRRYPMSIVMSIHQPSARLFAVFDRVYVMSEGCCLYEGSGQIDVVNAHLSRFGLECPKFHNIADYLIEIASGDLISEPTTTTTEGAGEVREQMINYQRKQRHWPANQSGSGADPGHLVVCSQQESHQLELVVRTWKPEEEVRLNGYEDGSSSSAECLGGGGSSSSSLYEAVDRARRHRQRPFYAQFLIHFTRSLLRIRRSYILTYLQLVTYILLGLQLSTFYGTDIGVLSGCPQLPMSFLAFVFSNETPDMNALAMRRIQENMNFLLVTIMTATFAALEITVITFPLEAKTVKREWRNGWYRVTSYFMGRTLADLPFQLVFVMVFCLVVYTLTGQIGLATWRFGSFVTIIVMTALVAQAVGFIFGALFMDNLPAAVFTAPLCIFPALLFSGFFSRVSQIPSFYKPFTYLSHFRYAFDAMIVTLYGYNRCQCEQAVLTSYHEGLVNQTSTIKDMFKSLFGVTECAPSADQSENSIEDATTMHTDDTLSMILNQTSGRLNDNNNNNNNIINNSITTTVMPRMLQTIKPLEDALVDSVFEHMSNTTETGEFKGDAMDRLTHKFSGRITTMLNSQANFGHDVPSTCRNFKSYLMTEFDLVNDDLIIGLLALFVFVIISRLLCNIILTFTIARRT